MWPKGFAHNVRGILIKSWWISNVIGSNWSEIYVGWRTHCTRDLWSELMEFLYKRLEWIDQALVTFFFPGRILSGFTLKVQWKIWTRNRCFIRHKHRDQSLDWLIMSYHVVKVTSRGCLLCLTTLVSNFYNSLRLQFVRCFCSRTRCCSPLIPLGILGFYLGWDKI